ncbi:MAG: ferritin family protein [Thermodesulfovibrionales bacterium]
MSVFTVREVIEQAVQIEKLGYQFYTEMAQRFREEEGLRKLFTTLAEKELRHEKVFKELLDMVGDSEPDGWDDISAYMRAMVESEFFLGKEKSLPAMTHIKTVDDAVKFAIGFEKETLLYFHGIRDAVKEKEIVDEIINEEKSHIMWLTRFRDSFLKK